jgi:hypothetical protein
MGSQPDGRGADDVVADVVLLVVIVLLVLPVVDDELFVADADVEGDTANAVLFHTFSRLLPPQISLGAPEQVSVHPLLSSVTPSGNTRPQKHSLRYSVPAKGRFLLAQNWRHRAVVMVSEVKEARGRVRPDISLAQPRGTQPEGTEVGGVMEELEDVGVVEGVVDVDDVDDVGAVEDATVFVLDDAVEILSVNDDDNDTPNA